MHSRLLAPKLMALQPRSASSSSVPTLLVIRRRLPSDRLRSVSHSQHINWWLWYLERSGLHLRQHSQTFRAKRKHIRERGLRQMMSSLASLTLAGHPAHRDVDQPSLIRSKQGCLPSNPFGGLVGTSLPTTHKNSDLLIRGFISSEGRLGWVRMRGPYIRSC